MAKLRVLRTGGCCLGRVIYRLFCLFYTGRFTRNFGKVISHNGIAGNGFFARKEKDSTLCLYARIDYSVVGQYLSVPFFNKWKGWLIHRVIILQLINISLLMHKQSWKMQTRTKLYQGGINEHHEIITLWKKPCLHCTRYYSRKDNHLWITWKEQDHYVSSGGTIHMHGTSVQPWLAGTWVLTLQTNIAYMHHTLTGTLNCGSRVQISVNVKEPSGW